MHRIIDRRLQTSTGLPPPANPVSHGPEDKHTWRRLATLTSHRGDMAMEASAFAGKPIEPSMPVTDHLRRLLEEAQTVVRDALAAELTIEGGNA